MKAQQYLSAALVCAVGYLGYQEIKRQTTLETSNPAGPPLLAAGRTATLDAISITNAKGEVLLTILGEPKPVLECRDSKGKVRRIDLSRLADRADMFAQDLVE